MRFMVTVKATKDTEAGILPSTEEFAAMGRFNEELVKAGMIKAGMMEAGEGLHPTAKGARMTSREARLASPAVRSISPAISLPASG